MSTPFPKKAPDEIVLLTFDFEGEVPEDGVLSNPTVECILIPKGDDGEITDVTINGGSIGVLGQKVLVLVGDGLTANTYRMSCEVDVDNGEHRRIDKDLPVDDKGALV